MWVHCKFLKPLLQHHILLNANSKQKKGGKSLAHVCLLWQQCGRINKCYKISWKIKALFRVKKSSFSSYKYHFCQHKFWISPQVSTEIKEAARVTSSSSYCSIPQQEWQFKDSVFSNIWHCTFSSSTLLISNVFSLLTKLMLKKWSWESLLQTATYIPSIEGGGL